MDIISVSKKIEIKIKTLELGREVLKERATEKANAIANYEKEIAKTLIKLKNGVEFDLDGEKIKDPPASIMDKLSRGICYKEKIESELKEAEYKNAIVGMQAIQCELNGWQSVFRFLEHESEGEYGKS